MAWKLYTDAACTTPFGGTQLVNSKQNLTDNPQDFTYYYANVDDDPMDSGSIKLEEQTDPGVNQIQLYVEDASPGSVHEATEITLALSSGDLGVNTPGDPLNLGTQLLSGASNALPVYVRVVNAVTTLGRSTELSIWVNATTATEA